MLPEKKKHSLLILGMGLFSALLFISGFGVLLFLLPLMYSSLRFGRKALVISSITAGVFIAGITLGIAGFTDLSLYSVIVSTVLLISFNITATKLPENFVLRCLITAVLLIPAALFAIPAMLNNETVKSMAVEQLNDLFVKNQIEVNAAFFYDEAVTLLSRISGASLFIFIFLNSWIGGIWFINRRYRSFVNVIIGASEALKQKERTTSGNEQNFEQVETDSKEELIKLAQKITEEHEAEKEIMYPYDLRAYHVPQKLIWLLITAWACILVSLKVQLPTFIINIAWNSTIIISFCYLFQGLAVIYTRLSLLPTATAARLGFTVILILLVVGGAVSLIVSIILMLLGTLETWIKLRPIKGELQ